MIKVAVIGPSKKFLSGISYYTIRLSNALSGYVGVKAILFRDMLPKRLFPGWKRVGKTDISNLEFNRKVEVFEILDWYNPLTWIKAFNVGRDCDVLIFQWWTSSVAHMHLVLEIMHKLSREIPVVLEFHEVVDPLESSIAPIKFYSRIGGMLVRSLADRYVVHSSADKYNVCSIYRLPDEFVHVIPHGVYDHYTPVNKVLARKKLGLSESEFVILFFGLLRPYKGVKYLIKAFERLPENVLNESLLLIVGEAWEDKETLKLAVQSPQSKKIRVANRYVPDSEVSLYFSAADVVVLPYLRASQSGVAHTAMAFGLPVISTPVGGLRESLSKYRGTIFVAPGNVEELTHAIVRVHDSARKRYSVPPELRWENIAKTWINLLKKLDL